LKVPAEAIKNYDAEAAINNIACSFHDNSSINYRPVFNAIEKWLEALEENKILYERLLQTEREKVALLEKILEKK